MGDEEDFTPHLGRQRSYGGARGPRYLGRILAAANLARGGAAGGQNKRGFSGSRTGRGAGVGRLLATRGRVAAKGARRVIVKARIVRLSGKGAAAAVAHLRYLQRDGTTREGERGTLYGRESDTIDGAAFTARGAGDRHQFRFIVSPEDGALYEDLKPLTRRLMARMEEDLGTRLDWAAVDHFNTGHPHSHIIVRGKDDRGGDLILARDYLTTGIRARAADLLALDLGPRSSREIAAGLRLEVEQERLTSIDRSLIRGADADRVVAAHGSDGFDQALRSGRLAKLARMGLAEPLGAARFRLAPDLADTLRQVGERGDIIRTMQRAYTRLGAERSLADQVIYNPKAPGAGPLIGRLMARGLADEHADRYHIIVDGLDGRSHYVATGTGAALGQDVESLPIGAIVEISPAQAEVRQADHMIAVIAAGNGGHYDIEAHLRHDARATETYAQTHIRRLEALRRAGVAEREPSGRWIIAEDHIARVEAYEARRVEARPVAVKILSAYPLEKLLDIEAATWIDRDLVAGSPLPVRDAGFGAALRDAQARRRQWLIAQEFAENGRDGMTFAPNMLSALQRRELLRVAKEITNEIKLPFHDPRNGAQVDGVYRRSLDLVSGRFAVIERAYDFTLVPWRPVLEPHIGKAVSGIMRGDGINWTIGRGRSGPSIS
ncbi:relaxase/mobilization nuclease and DUF3363 domain-containing protein [Sphingobium phenoxybenzoativorans]|uniref:Relaxase/mobilization nuclease and DUF3363 domain-containing protein n=1 Tax=Sphingobium phenoxybenzoativorans TaxID=1592790 RepID=A0A975Q190_9SPHN|nr:relaxase/mobilization nuclease RlxS [Sphingobium phenoxybenzoativorans]QUT05127.1 relaxase/mobilization nuclease and DUF3363 domain-containing protein [Sphingobium phenoxybenzoativorans]